MDKRWKWWSRVIVYDFETNGVWSPLNQPIEVYMKIIEGEKLSFFHTFIQCPTRLNSLVMKHTGITDAVLQKKGKPLETVFRAHIAPILERHRENTLLVGYYNRHFDDRFLNNYLNKFGLRTWDEKQVWDCFARFKQDVYNIQQLPNESTTYFENRCISFRTGEKHAMTLRDACEYYRIRHNGIFHRAKQDTEKTYRIFVKQVNLRLK